MSVKKTIEIKEFGIVIELDSGNFSSTGAWAGGTITSTMHEEIVLVGLDALEVITERTLAALYNAGIDALEALILAHAISGLDVEDQRYIHGIRTACEGMAKATE
jgi:hypothetical protein